MIDPKILEKHGVTAAAYAKKFNASASETAGTFAMAEGPKKLLQRISARLRDGVQQNLTTARLWWAIDRSYDKHFEQISYTLLQGLIDKDTSKDTVLSKFKEWGVAHMLTDVPCTCGTANCNCVKTKKLDLPVFFNIFVPLVQAYVIIRWAKLFNDRDLYPGFKFDPVKLTLENRLRAEILTDRIQKVFAQMGYRSVKRQVIFQQLLYSVCLQFPMEPWWREKQMTSKGDEVIIKEGVRYIMPHPSRMGWDLGHRPDTLNSDTGCDFAYYWHICRNGDLQENPDYWNKGQISYGSDNWLKMGQEWLWYNQLFPCTIKYPLEGVSAQGQFDRQNAMQYYATDQYDKGVVLAEMHMRFKPKQFDLADYDYPVWHRCVMANDMTPLYIEPFAYRPVNFYGLDYDGNRTMNAGIGLKVMPFQDMVGNLLTQYILTIQKNLTKVTFYNQDILNQQDIAAINNLGQKKYSDIPFIPFSKRQMQWAQENQKEAFVSFQFPQSDPYQILAAVKGTLDILERVLGYSAQELGQAASHEQSAAEMHVLSENTNESVRFSGGFTDDGLYAWKSQLHDATMAYSDDKVFAQVGQLNDQKRAALKKLGFEVETEADEEGEYKAGVSGSKSALALEEIANTRDNTDRVNNPGIASAMVQLIQSLVSSERLVEAVGIKRVLEWYNYAAILLGLPTDFKIDAAKSVEQQTTQMQEQLAGAAQQAAQEVVNANVNELIGSLKEKVIAPLEQAIQQLGAADQQLAQTDQQLQANDQALQKAIQDSIATLAQALNQRFQQLEAVVAQAAAPALPPASPELSQFGPPAAPAPPIEENVNLASEPALV